MINENENDVSGRFEQPVESLESSEKMKSLNTRKANPKILYDTTLIYEFQMVPVMTRNEGEWYGPWSSLLHRLFPSQQGFQISHQRQLANMPEGPEWSVSFLVKHHAHIIACIAEIKPTYHYNSHKLRIKAYERLKEKLEICLEDGVEEDVSVIYGLSCIGTRFMIMKLDTRTKLIRPRLDEEPASKGIAKVAPKHWWGHQVLTRQGWLHLNSLVEQVKLNTNYELVTNYPVPIESLPDDGSDVEAPTDDDTDGDEIWN